jgi:general secretion pathway protein D
MRILGFICVFLLSIGCRNLLEANEVQSLMLSDESLPQVLYILEKLTGKSILCDQSVANVKLSLQIRQPLSRQDAIRALENALGLNGVAIIDRGDEFLRAVSTRMAPTYATEWLAESVLPMPSSDKIYTKLFPLEHIAAVDFARIIRPILSQVGAFALTFEDSNCVLITDKLSNLQRVELIISNVDRPRCSKVESKIFRIKHGDAENIASILRRLIQPKNSPEIRRSEDGSENVPNKIMPLNNFAPQGENRSDAQEFRFSRNVAIEHDRYSNSIIACGTSQDIAHVEKIIDGLDILLEQVRIEVVIAQVTLTNDETSGLDSLGISYNVSLGTDGKSPTYAGDNCVKFAGKGASNEKIGAGFNVNGTLSNFSLGYVFNKAKTCDNVKVLSAPTIVTTHNREASIKVSESRPVITANLTDLKNPQSIRNSVSYKDIGIELVVTPLIGTNGIIQMKIDQLIQNINGDVEIDGNKQPIITKRQAISFLSVADGEVIVLAGLQEKESVDSGGKLWLLGYIPIIGDILFSPKAKSERTNELLIFIRPSIIANPSSEDSYLKKVSRNSALEPEINSYNSSGKFLIGSDKIETRKPKSRSTKSRAM